MTFPSYPMERPRLGVSARADAARLSRDVCFLAPTAVLWVPRASSSSERTRIQCEPALASLSTYANPDGVLDLRRLEPLFLHADEPVPTAKPEACVPAKIEA
jgi:hypothetical protein